MKQARDAFDCWEGHRCAPVVSCCEPCTPPQLADMYLVCLDDLSCCALPLVMHAGLTLADVRLSVLKGGSNKVLAAAQRGGLLFTHKVCAYSTYNLCICVRQRKLCVGS